MPTPQSAILPPVSPHALFLTLHLQAGDEALRAVRAAAAGFSALVETQAALDPDAHLVGSLAFGAEMWGRLSPQRPTTLTPFVTLGSGALSAPATGGDLQLHLHGARADLNFRCARAFIEPLRPFIAKADETHGFMYLDARDLTGFIDGTENPEGEEERAEAALIGDEDPEFAGGSYVIAQRYVHKLHDWERLAEHEQEGIIGRSKPDSVELDDEIKPPTAHIARVVIEEDGEELEIVRHSLPYGSASGDAGLFFIAYAKDLSIFQKMLARMFGQGDDGLSDHLMQFTQAVSGGYFFAPSKERLAQLGG